MDSRSSIDSSTMMLDWNEQDQIGGTLWPDLMVSKDHIVPYSIESEDHPLFRFGDYSMNKKNKADTADAGSSVQSSRTKNEDFSYKSESRSSFHTGEELTYSRIEMDPWSLDFPNLCMELRDGNSHSSATEMMNDLSDASNLNSWSGDLMRLDCEPESLGLDDKQNGDFHDCDWDAFGGLDDIEILFRKNDPMCGHDMIGSDDGFLSPSKSVINSAAQSIPMPDLSLCNDQISNESCSSVLLDDHSEKQGSPLRKEKVDGQNKAEDGRMIRPNSSDPQLMPSTNVHSHGSSNQTRHGYPIYCFSGMQFPPHFQIDGNKKRPLSSNHEVCPDDAKHQKTSNRASASKPTIMKPQEKMEKLRRLQKMQAHLAIERQHQQLTQSKSNQVLDSLTSTTGADEWARRVSSSELNMLPEKDESMRTSSLTYDSPLEETIYHQLQEVVEKLDMRIRLCIRDSLSRLASSAVERHRASDEDEVAADEEFRDRKKSTTLADSETHTNPIDRIVASLLFQGITDACRRISLYELLSST